MNNYEKMTLESFVKNLHAKKYKSATAARRGVGKSQDLSNADKDKGRAAIDKFFGVAGPKKAAKKIPPKVKTAPKKAAKKVAAKSDAHIRTAKAVTKKYSKRQPVVRTTHGHADPIPSTDARVMRQHSASQIFSALYGKQPLDADLETRLLRAAALEYLANSSVLDKNENPAEATPAISKKERVSRARATKASTAEPQPEAEASAPESGPEPSTNGVVDPSNWTAEQRAQSEHIAARKAQAEGTGG